MDSFAKKLKAVSKLVGDILPIYSQPLKTFLQESTFIIKQKRFSNGEQVDGTYDIETGEIILWEPEINDREGLFFVITHEWGHKIYNEWLNADEVREWLFVRTLEKIDFDLNQVYAAVKRPEEEFCTLFSLISLAEYLDRKDMKIQSKKLKIKLKRSFPKAARLLEKYTAKKLSCSTKQNRQITHREVEKLKEWVHKVMLE